mgnify:FL=1
MINMKKMDKELKAILKKRKKTNILRQMFGAHKLNKPVEQIMKEMDRDLYDI